MNLQHFDQLNLFHLVKRLDPNPDLRLRNTVKNCLEHILNRSFMLVNRLGWTISNQIWKEMAEILMFWRGVQVFLTVFKWIGSIHFFGLLFSGAVPSTFYLNSVGYVSDRLLTRINKFTSSVMQSGINRFYVSYTRFKRNILERAYLDDENDNFHALTADQLKRPMILVFCLWGVALIVFIAEIAVSKYRNRNRRHWVLFFFSIIDSNRLHVFTLRYNDCLIDWLCFHRFSSEYSNICYCSLF